MSNVRLTTDGGSTRVTTLLAMSQQVADPATIPDVVTALVQKRRADVVLRGGIRATVTYADPVVGVPVQALQVLLPAPRQGPFHEYEAEVRLAFELPVRIRCQAETTEDAVELIEHVFDGAEHGGDDDPAPVGFHLEILPEDLADLMNHISCGNMHSRAHRLHAHVMDISAINEVLLLTGPAREAA